MNCNNCGNVLYPSDKLCPICSTPNPNYKEKEVKINKNTNILMVLTTIFSIIILSLTVFFFIRNFPNLLLYLSVATAVEFLLLILALMFSKNSTIKAIIIIPMLTVLISIVLIFLAFQDQEKRKPVNYIKDQNVVYKVNKEYFYNDKVNDNIVLFRKASKNYLSLIKSSELENIDITNKKDYEKFYNMLVTLLTKASKGAVLTKAEDKILKTANGNYYIRFNYKKSDGSKGFYSVLLASNSDYFAIFHGTGKDVSNFQEFLKKAEFDLQNNVEFPNTKEREKKVQEEELNPGEKSYIIKDMKYILPQSFSKHDGERIPKITENKYDFYKYQDKAIYLLVFNDFITKNYTDEEVINYVTKDFKITSNTKVNETGFNVLVTESVKHKKYILVEKNGKKLKEEQKTSSTYMIFYKYDNESGRLIRFIYVIEDNLMKEQERLLEILYSTIEKLKFIK